MIMRKIRDIIDKIANRIIVKTEWYREGFWKGTTKFWTLSSCDHEVVNLGSNSAKYAFNYDSLPIKGQNWAIGPQSLVHDFNILKNYFSYLKEGGIVLIPVCPFSCLQVAYNKDANFKYYPILHPATIIGFDDAERTRAYKIRINPFKEMPLYCIKKTVKEVFSKITGKLRGNTKVDFDKNAELWVQTWKKQFAIEDLNSSLSGKHKQEQANRAETLREIILFCKERNLKPYIVLPPVHPGLSSRLSDYFMRNYVYNFIETATDDRTNVLDYFKDASFQNDGYFQNSFFLNSKGAIAFTERVLKDLNLI